MNGDAACSSATPLGWPTLPTCKADLGIAGYGPHRCYREGRWSFLWWATVAYDFLRWSHPARGRYAAGSGATCEGAQIEW